MSEQTQQQTNAPLTIEGTVALLQSYLQQADKSLANLDNSINSAHKQVDEWQRMKLMIVGQKQLIVDLINKTTAPTTPAPVPTSTETAVN